MDTPQDSTAASFERGGSRTKLELQGKISRRNLVHVELDGGTTVTAPEEVLFKPGALGTIGDIIDIVCKFINCGGGGGGGGGGGDNCTTIVITNPDGSSTTIKTCPPAKAIG